MYYYFISINGVQIKIKYLLYDILHYTTIINTRFNNGRNIKLDENKYKYLIENGIMAKILKIFFLTK